MHFERWIEAMEEFRIHQECLNWQPNVDEATIGRVPNKKLIGYHYKQHGRLFDTELYSAVIGCQRGKLYKQQQAAVGCKISIAIYWF